RLHRARGRRVRPRRTHPPRRRVRARQGQARLARRLAGLRPRRENRGPADLSDAAYRGRRVPEMGRRTPAATGPLTAPLVTLDSATGLKPSQTVVVQASGFSTGESLVVTQCAARDFRSSARRDLAPGFDRGMLLPWGSYWSHEAVV